MNKLRSIITKKHRGFTLIELLVVIAIIGILAGMVLPALVRARESCNRVVCAGQLQQIGTAVMFYAEDNGGLLPGGGPLFNYLYVVYRNTSGLLDASHWNGCVPLGLAPLYEKEGGIIADPMRFYCPSNKFERFQYQTYSNPPPWGTFPQASGANILAIGYSYFPIEGDGYKGWDIDAISGATNKELPPSISFNHLSNNYPYVSDVIAFKSQLSHGTGNTCGGNFLFKDGHVVFNNDNTPNGAFGYNTWYPWDLGNPKDYRHCLTSGFMYIVYTRVNP